MVLSLRLGTAFLFGALLVMYGAEAPRFEEFATPVEAVKRAAPVRLVDRESRRYRTELREAAQKKPDFAGHYVLATWGCGAGCVMAAAIDAKTGTVTRLPFTVSNWPLSVTEPLEYKLDSRLLIVHGSRNEKGNGTYYYEFAGDSFKLVREMAEAKP